MDFLNAREQAEVRLAQLYHDNFDHGTAGHLAYTVIAKLAAKIHALEADITRLKEEAEDTQEFMD